MRRPNVKLKTILLERGITQRELAWEAGLDEALVSKAVRHNRTTADIRERIADFLDVDQNEIFNQRRA
jgi:DNA-binding Xre family transcriptional regulator